MFDTTETELIEELAEYEFDPLGFVWYAFPWGEAGSELEHAAPEDWQLQILRDIAAGLITIDQAIQLAVTSGHGVGKLHRYSQVVDTPTGRKRWGDLNPGDQVFGADGTPTKIIQCHHYRNAPMYRVTFDDDSYVDVSSGHLWNVRGRRERRNKLDGWRTLETIELVEMGVKRPNGVSMARQWEIPVQGAAEFEEREVDLHPYLVGVWLGDGSKGLPRYTKPDTEIRDRLKELGYELTESSDGVSVYLPNIRHLMTSAVFDCGSSDRYIPDDYKYNTVENRRALFEGLCDTDGEVYASGSIGFCSTSRRLVEDFIWLARSLGYKAMLRAAPKEAGYYSDEGWVQCKTAYQATVNAPVNPFSIARKRAAYKPSEHRYTVRWIDSIEPIESSDGMCITVEAEDGLYLANDFVVTHNSALVAWIILWAVSTMPDTKGVVTANTENQLKTKTWVQVATWYRLFIGRSLFKLAKTALFSVDPEHENTWRFDMVPWSERNTEAFAGLHNAKRRIVVIFDEASAIPDVIWEVTEGALTDEETQIIWAVFGNPTRNAGRFRECFAGGKFAHRWKSRAIDSRSVSLTNKEQLQRWVEDYGEDHDFVRVRVRGVFPRQDAVSFIPLELAREAAVRQLDLDIVKGQPLVIGVDVARYGDDVSVIYFRKGRDGRSLQPEIYQGLSTVQLAAHVASAFQRHAAAMVFVDGGGVGGGVVDNLRRLRVPHMEVQFGAKPDGINLTDPQTKYANKRAEIWGAMRDWLADGAIPDQIPSYDQDLTTELAGPTFAFNNREEIQLERKDDMRRRGVKSPNIADALACTFAYPVYTPPLTQELEVRKKPEDYNPYDQQNIYEETM